MFIPDYVKNVTEILYAAGEEAFLVGGCVRDAIMGKLPHDYDIAVSCVPERTEELFDGFRVIETGIRHGTVTVVSDGNNLELTTFRIDGEYRDNRRPESVSFTRSIVDDLARRDFTANAIAYSEKTGFVDPFGGRDDIEKGLIRCVGEPDRRFNEDALRIVRGMRFASVLGFDIDKETAEGMIRNRALLNNIAGERIFSELKKLLVGKKSTETLVRFDDVMCEIFPELFTLDVKNRRTSYEHTGGAMHPETGFAAVFYGVSTADVTRALSRLKTDRAFSDTVLLLMACGENYDSGSASLAVGEKGKTAYLRLFAGKHGAKKTELLAELLRLTRGEEPTAEQFIADGCRGAVSAGSLEVGGSEMKALGKTGEQIGKALERLAVLVALGEVPNERNALLDAAQSDI